MKTSALQFLAAAMIAVVLIGACGGSGGSSSLDQDAENLRGQKIFQANCAVCHGQNGEDNRTGTSERPTGPCLRRRSTETGTPGITGTAHSTSM